MSELKSAVERLRNRRPATEQFISLEDVRAIGTVLDELADHEASFDLRWKADMRAIERWRGDDPAKTLTMPDHTDLCIWLLEKWDTTRREVQVLVTAGITATERAERAEARAAQMRVHAKGKPERSCE